MRMKKVLCLVMVSLLSLSFVVLAEEISKEKGMKGKLGIGGDYSRGIIIRYWLTEKSGIDTGMRFFTGESDREGYEVDLSSIYLLKKKGNLDLLSLLSVNGNRRNGGSMKVWSVGVSYGLGVEYSFQELPDLSFGAFLTGFGFSYENFKQDDEVDISREFSTRPVTSLSAIYYF